MGMHGYDAVEAFCTLDRRLLFRAPAPPNASAASISSSPENPGCVNGGLSEVIYESKANRVTRGSKKFKEETCWRLFFVKRILCSWQLGWGSSGSLRLVAPPGGGQTTETPWFRVRDASALERSCLGAIGKELGYFFQLRGPEGPGFSCVR